MQSVIVYFLLFLLPFIYIPFGISPFEVPKIIASEIGITLLTLLYIFSWNKQVIRQTIVHVLGVMLLIFAVSLFHFFMNSSNTAITGNIFRLQGVILFWFLLLFSVVSSQISVKARCSFLAGISIAALFLGIFIFGQNINGRPVSFLGEPNALAGVIVFLFPFVLSFKNKKLIYSVGLISVVVLVLSQSTSGQIAFAVEILFLILYKKTTLSLKMITVLCLAICVLSLVLPFLHRTIYEDRAEIWQIAASAGLSSPVIGHGVGTVDILIAEGAKKIDSSLQVNYVDSSHNFILDWWIELGAVGVISLLFLITNAFLQFIKQKNTQYIMILLGLIVVMSFNPVSVCILIGFWWLIGKSLIKT